MNIFAHVLVASPEVKKILSYIGVWMMYVLSASITHNVWFHHLGTKDLMLYLVWDEESEEHLDSTILGNSFSATDDTGTRKRKGHAPSTSEATLGPVQEISLIQNSGNN